jgi:esterase/lipase
LVQWTTKARYDGLGSFCNKYGCDPSSLKGQLRYMVNENHFQQVLPHFQGHGSTISQYMNSAYRWLGWGIRGYRVDYAYNYLRQFIWA